MTDNHFDLESRVTDALDSRASTITPSFPPAFSWENTDSHIQLAPRSTRRLSRRVVAAGGGLVAAAAVAAVVATTLSGQPTTSGGPQATNAGSAAPSNHARVAANAPALLLAAAHTRLRLGDAPLADGQYRYIKTISPAPDLITYPKGGTKPHLVAPPADAYTLDELWIPKDQTTVWERKQSVVDDPSGGSPMVWKGRCGDLYVHTQDGPKGPACTRSGSFGDPSPAFVAGLPRNADTLYAKLRKYSEKHLNPQKIHKVNFEMFSVADSLLESSVLPSDLTSTLYKVLSRIPGISVVQHARNYSGTEGTGFRISTTFGQGKDALPSTQTIIVDLGTGAFLGDRTVEYGADYSSAVTVGVADHLGQRPGK